MRIRRLGQFATFLVAVISFGTWANAAHTTHPGYSAQGGNKSATQYNLLCDPSNAISGSTSTDYSADLGVAAIDSVTPAPGFEITDIQIYLTSGGTFNFVDDLADQEGLLPSTSTVPVAEYISGFQETGFIQVSWRQLSDPPAVDGDTITDTVTFDNTTGVPGTPATFMNYGDPGKAHGGIFDADSYTVDNGDGTTTTYSADPTSTDYPKPGVVYSDGFVGAGGIAPATVTIVPEPSLLGCFGLLGLVLRRRR